MKSNNCFAPVHLGYKQAYTPKQQSSFLLLLALLAFLAKLPIKLD